MTLPQITPSQAIANVASVIRDKRVSFLPIDDAVIVMASLDVLSQIVAEKESAEAAKAQEQAPPEPKE